MYNIVKELRKSKIKNSMATGIAQKSCIAYYFHCGLLGKMICRKIKNIYQEET